MPFPLGPQLRLNRFLEALPYPIALSLTPRLLQFKLPAIVLLTLRGRLNKYSRAQLTNKLNLAMGNLSKPTTLTRLRSIHPGLVVKLTKTSGEKRPTTRLSITRLLRGAFLEKKNCLL